MKNAVKNFRNAATLGGFLVLMAATLAVGVTSQRKADALPKYANKEKKPCTYCHVNPSGGKRNATGTWYGAHNHSFVGYTSEKAATAFGGAAGATTPSGVTGAAPKPTPKPIAKPTAKPGAKKSATKPGAKPAPKKK